MILIFGVEDYKCIFDINFYIAKIWRKMANVYHDQEILIDLREQ